MAVRSAASWRVFRSDGICEPPVEFLYQGGKVLFLGLAFWDEQAKGMRFYGRKSVPSRYRGEQMD